MCILNLVFSDTDTYQTAAAYDDHDLHADVADMLDVTWSIGPDSTASQLYSGPNAGGS